MARTCAAFARRADRTSRSTSRACRSCTRARRLVVCRVHPASEPSAGNDCGRVAHVVQPGDVASPCAAAGRRRVDEEDPQRVVGDAVEVAPDRDDPDAAPTASGRAIRRRRAVRDRCSRSSRDPTTRGPRRAASGGPATRSRRSARRAGPTRRRTGTQARATTPSTASRSSTTRTGRERRDRRPGPHARNGPTEWRTPASNGAHSGGKRSRRSPSSSVCLRAAVAVVDPEQRTGGDRQHVVGREMGWHAGTQPGLRLAPPDVGGDRTPDVDVAERGGERGDGCVAIAGVRGSPRRRARCRTRRRRCGSRSSRLQVTVMTPIVRCTEASSTVSAAWGNPRGSVTQSPGSRTRSSSGRAELVRPRLGDRRPALERSLAAGKPLPHVPALATGQLHDDDVVEVEVDVEAASGRRAEVRVHLDRLIEREGQIRRQPGVGGVAELQRLEHDRGPRGVVLEHVVGLDQVVDPATPDRRLARATSERGSVLPSRTSRNAGARVPPVRKRSHNRSASDQSPGAAVDGRQATSPLAGDDGPPASSWSCGASGWNSRRSIQRPVTNSDQASVPSVSPPSVPSVSPPSVPSVSPPSVPSVSPPSVPSVSPPSVPSVSPPPSKRRRTRSFRDRRRKCSCPRPYPLRPVSANEERPAVGSRSR